MLVEPPIHNQQYFHNSLILTSTNKNTAHYMATELIHENIVTLSNGKRVANFSSPHEFVYEDGTILPAVSNELSNKLKVTFTEIPMGEGDIILKFSLSEDLQQQMLKYFELYNNSEVDVVVCPLPMITALKEDSRYGMDYLYHSPFRSIRIEDRIKKLVSIHKQCL